MRRLKITAAGLGLATMGVVAGWWRVRDNRQRIEGKAKCVLPLFAFFVFVFSSKRANETDDFKTVPSSPVSSSPSSSSFPTTPSTLSGLSSALTLPRIPSSTTAGGTEPAFSSPSSLTWISPSVVLPGHPYSHPPRARNLDSSFEARRSSVSVPFSSSSTSSTPTPEPSSPGLSPATLTPVPPPSLAGSSPSSSSPSGSSRLHSSRSRQLPPGTPSPLHVRRRRCCIREMDGWATSPERCWEVTLSLFSRRSFHRSLCTTKVRFFPPFPVPPLPFLVSDYPTDPSLSP